MTTSSELLTFWVNAGEAAWYKQDDAFDADIRARFGAVWQEAHAGSLPDWAVDAPGALSLLILLDQVPRNIFRGDARSFATDAQALEVSGQMLARGWDRAIEGPLRQFAYMPFMHSEDLAHQDISVDLFGSRMAEGDNLLHARAHREIIVRYGRFPYRNAVLDRETTAEERAFLDGGAYGSIVRELQGTGTQDGRGV